MNGSRKADRSVLRKIVCSFFTASTMLAWGGLLAQETPPSSSPRVLVLSLEDALGIALGESETIWAAEAGVMRAMGSTRIARSGFFPQVSGTASYTRTLRSQFDDIDFGGAPGGETPDDGALEDLPFGQVNQYTLGLTLNQLIFDAGQTGARNRAAQARRRSAEIDVTAARAETLLDVTQRYFDALSERPAGGDLRGLARADRGGAATDPGGAGRGRQIGVRAAAGAGGPGQPAPPPAPAPDRAPGRLPAPEAAPERPARRRVAADHRRRGSAGPVRHGRRSYAGPAGARPSGRRERGGQRGPAFRGSGTAVAVRVAVVALRARGVPRERDSRSWRLPE